MEDKTEEMREACIEAAAAWHESCQTEREHELINAICGDMRILQPGRE